MVCVHTYICVAHVYVCICVRVCVCVCVWVLAQLCNAVIVVLVSLGRVIVHGEKVVSLCKQRRAASMLVHARLTFLPPTLLYRCLTSLFDVTLQVPPGQKQYTVSALDSASIVLVVQGEGTGSGAEGDGSPAAGPGAVARGTVLFLAAHSALQLDVRSDGMLMFRAYCQL